MINPVSLLNSNANQMFEDIDKWAGRVDRLRSQKAMPKDARILFAFEQPPAMDSLQNEAIELAKVELDALCIEYVRADEENKIVHFAKEPLELQ